MVERAEEMYINEVAMATRLISM